MRMPCSAVAAISTFITDQSRRPPYTKVSATRLPAVILVELSDLMPQQSCVSRRRRERRSMVFKKVPRGDTAKRHSRDLFSQANSGGYETNATNQHEFSF